MKLVPVTVESKCGDIVSVHFDITLVVSKDNQIIVVDNTQQDAKEIVDCNTLLMQEFKLEIS